MTSVRRGKWASIPKKSLATEEYRIRQKGKSVRERSLAISRDILTCPIDEVAVLSLKEDAGEVELSVISSSFPDREIMRKVLGVYSSMKKRGGKTQALQLQARGLVTDVSMNARRTVVYVTLKSIVGTGEQVAWVMK